MKQPVQMLMEPGGPRIACCLLLWFAGQRPEDGVPDMTTISDIDVFGVNTNLRVRFARDEIYTYTGTILVAVNPYQFLPMYEKVSRDVLVAARIMRHRVLAELIYLFCKVPGGKEDGVARRAHTLDTYACVLLFCAMAGCLML